MSERRKQWTTEEISTLIDAFREHRNLWDAKDVQYKNRIKKIDSYNELAQLFDTNAAEIERKLKNLISQYQRERRKYKKMKKSGAGQSFKAKWFGYNAMNFMHDRNKPRKGIQIGGQYEESESSDDEYDLLQSPSDVTSETEERSQLVEKVNSTLPMEIPQTQTQKVSNSSVQKNMAFPHQQKLTTPIKKLKKKNNKNTEEDSESTQVFHMMKSMYEKRERDEYDVFGEMVAHNIRNFKSDYSKITVQQQITNLLYDARKFQFPQHNVQTFIPASSPSPSSQSSITDMSHNTTALTIRPEQEVSECTVVETSNYIRPTDTNILQRAFTSLFELPNSSN